MADIDRMYRRLKHERMLRQAEYYHWYGMYDAADRLMHRLVVLVITDDYEEANGPEEEQEDSEEVSEVALELDIEVEPEESIEESRYYDPTNWSQ